MNSDHYVEDRNLSVAWARGLRTVSSRGRREMAPLVIAVTGFDEAGRFEEETAIRNAVDAFLETEGMQSVGTVASTIFPSSLWNPGRERAFLFERYRKIVPRLRKASPKNRRGTYFERMITGGPKGQENQLDFAITSYLARRSVRRSALQVGVFDPNLDHSAAAQLGFPCLQHVTLAPTDAGLTVNAFYAVQYFVERAYGNYVGLCRLGQFVAHEMNLPLVRITCFTGIAECDVAKNKLTDVLVAINTVLGPREQ